MTARQGDDHNSLRQVVAQGGRAYCGRRYLARCDIHTGSTVLYTFHFDGRYKVHETHKVILMSAKYWTGAEYAWWYHTSAVGQTYSWQEAYRVVGLCRRRHAVSRSLVFLCMVVVCVGTNVRGQQSSPRLIPKPCTFQMCFL